VRSRGSLIKSTNGHSNGIVPWLKTLDSLGRGGQPGRQAQGRGLRLPGAWHADIEEFLELRDNTGDEARRTHNLNLANWIPDLFMQRVEADATGRCSIRKRGARPHRPVRRGLRARLCAGRGHRARQSDDQGARAVRAHDAHARADRQRLDDLQGQPPTAPATRPAPGNVVHLSNLCTEILEVNSNDETAVCNLGSINLAAAPFRRRRLFDFDKLAETVRVAVRQLDRVIDLNFYPIETARRGNLRWRPVGLG
jgi:ribonucleoside-diphosphate reductase alpha chain